MEEDIKVLEEFLNNYKQVQEKYKDDEIQAEIERSCYFEEVPAQAIENLIKRNKELEEENKKYPIKMNDEQYNKTIDNAQKELREELERQINVREISEKFIEDNFISKSKIREKIEEIEKQGIWIDEDYYYNEELGKEYPICKKKFTKEELEEVVIDILKKLQKGDK